MEAPRVTEVIEHELRIAARPETVFAYFTDPTRLIQWMGVEATLDPRPGGVCRIDVTGGAVMIGEFVEVEPPRRLVLSWGWEKGWFETPSSSTLVEVAFTPDGEHTILHLSHGRLPAADSAHCQSDRPHDLVAGQPASPDARVLRTGD